MKFLIKILNAYLFTIVSLFGLRVLAWGKQGHAIVNQTAALLLSEETKYDFLREHAFDLAYFSNVPDIVWKQQKTYDLKLHSILWIWRFLNVNLKSMQTQAPN